MEAGFIILLVIVAAASLTIGLLIGRAQLKRRYVRDTQFTQGVLNVDCSDPEFEPGLFLGLSVPVKDVVTRKYVAFDVNVFLENSRK